MRWRLIVMMGLTLGMGVGAPAAEELPVNPFGIDPSTRAPASAGDPCSGSIPSESRAAGRVEGRRSGAPGLPGGLHAPLIGRPAPALEVEAWFNSQGLSLEGLRGKVVVLEFFQLWCPGCNAFSIPLITRWSQDTFADEPGIVFVSVHTVFEGHDVQTNNRLSRFLVEKHMRQPVAVDRHRGGDPVPVTMRRYRTGGTPCIVIVDQQGVVRFKYLGAFQPEPVETFLRHLLRATPTTAEAA